MSNYIKHPKTLHLPWSRSIDESDKVLEFTECFHGKEVIVTAKLDGENTTMTRDHIHARSLDSRDHISRHWVKNLHSTIKGEIPEEWRIVGENMYAEHSIHYNNLKSYFYAFFIWDENNMCLSWNNFIDWCELLNIDTVPVLYDGIWDEEKIKGLYTPTFDGCDLEGYVVRIKDAFHFDDFHKSTGKFVRKNHVCKKHFWRERIVPNELGIINKGEKNGSSY